MVLDFLLFFNISSGGYKLKEADGTLRVVEYHSGPHGGINMIVKRIGHAAHPSHYGHGGYSGWGGAGAYNGGWNGGYDGGYGGWNNGLY